jgi:hypothetical protein
MVHPLGCLFQNQDACFQPQMLAENGGFTQLVAGELRTGDGSDDDHHDT